MSITITRARKIVDLCTNADLLAAHEAAVKALTAADRKAATDARETDTSLRDAAARVVEVESEMLAHSVRFTLEAMRRKGWAEYVAAHPPREGDKLDEQFGVDVSSLDAAIIAMTVSVTSAATGEPVTGFDVARDWEALADEMTNPQWEAFALAVLRLNQGEDAGTSVPFSRAASLVMRRSEQTSRQPSGSASA